MVSDAIRQIQQALKASGCNPGDIDGIWGRNTIEAVRQFQEKNHLAIDGIVGPQTKTALFRVVPPPAAPVAASSSAPSAVLLPWYEEARHLIGTKEVIGPGNSPDILKWAKDLSIDYSGDDVPWCGLFVSHCVGSTLPQEVLPSHPLGARQWEEFGDPTDPRLGSVLVFWRGSPTSGLGHVGFYAGQDAEGKAYQILGGNQSDQVCFAWVSADRLLGARWPKTARSLASAPVRKIRTQGLSINEG